MAEDSMETKAPLAPITKKHKIRHDLVDNIPKPYLARALVASDIEHASGTPGHANQGLSVLQQHVAFFDTNKDGVIYPWETYIGLRKIGCNVTASIILALVFHLLFSYPTLTGCVPSILLPIYIINIHKGKHGSDSGVYDTEGRFIPASFENMFSKYALTSPDKMSFMEVWNMTEGNRVAYNLSGWILSKTKWGLLYLLAKEEGFLSKETIRGMYDGSLFESYAKNSKKH